MLGVPLGHPDFIKRFLQRKIDEHKVLLDRIPIIPDVQAAWLILSYCASAKSNFFLRGVSPAHSGECALLNPNAVGCQRQPCGCLRTGSPMRPVQFSTSRKNTARSVRCSSQL